MPSAIPAAISAGLAETAGSRLFRPHCGKPAIAHICLLYTSVIEPSLGADRAALAFLCDAYDEEEIAEGDVRVVLRLHPALAPYKAAVLPLSKKLADKAGEVFDMLAAD